MDYITNYKSNNQHTGYQNLLPHSISHRIALMSVKFTLVMFNLLCFIGQKAFLVLCEHRYTTRVTKSNKAALQVTEISYSFLFHTEWHRMLVSTLVIFNILCFIPQKEFWCHGNRDTTAGSPNSTSQHKILPKFVTH